MKHLIKILILSSLVIAPFYTFSGCIPNANVFKSQKGPLYIGVKFPEVDGFNLKVIPEDTEKVELKIKSRFLEENQIIELNKDKPSIVLNIHFGKIILTATAFDKSNNPIAIGEVEKEVKPYVTNSVELELKGTTNTSSIGNTIQPTPIPEIPESPQPERTFFSETSSKQFSSGSLDIDDQDILTLNFDESGANAVALISNIREKPVKISVYNDFRDTNNSERLLGTVSNAGNTLDDKNNAIGFLINFRKNFCFSDLIQLQMTFPDGTEKTKFFRVFEPIDLCPRDDLEVEPTPSPTPTPNQGGGGTVSSPSKSPTNLDVEIEVQEDKTSVEPVD